MTAVCLCLSTGVFGDDSPRRVVKKVCLKKEKDIYFLCAEFDEQTSFVPRIHTLPNGVRVWLSFNCNVEAPETGKILHPLMAGYFFEKFSPSSLEFVAALREKVTFVSKTYTKNSIKIGFRVNGQHTVIIDAGHGGRDPGTEVAAAGGENDTICEKDITLVTALELRNALTASGKYKVILTRDRDEAVSLDDRKKKIDSSGGDFLISLHADSNRDKNLRGMSVYTLPDSDRIRRSSIDAAGIASYEKTLIKSKKFSGYLIKYVPNACKISRPCRDGELKILKTNIPAVLIELGCVSNAKDRELLLSRDFRNKAVRAIRYALDNFFEGEKVE
ncbi:MAG: N-acetylmuramoyl-L-alanine amidase [Holosporaceae bacterium]|nr:N-acetylmuramoyl-L-alanine amidase [Holosporaceae bacterium]